MDKERNLRFVVPPFVLLLSLAGGVYLDRQSARVCYPGDAAILEAAMSLDIGGVVAVIAGGGAFVVAVGFLLSSATVCVLTILSWFRGIFDEIPVLEVVDVTRSQWWLKPWNYIRKPTFKFCHFIKEMAINCCNRHYSAMMKQATLDRIVSEHLNMGSESKMQRYALFVAASFDHQLLPKPIHDWLLRRWTFFHMYANSCVAVFAAFVLGTCLLKLEPTKSWKVSSIVVFVPLLVNAVVAWRETMGMLAFQARRAPRGQ